MILMIVVLYMAAAALFYLRLTATASGMAVPKQLKPSHWHRARHTTKVFLRRVRLSPPKR